MLDKIVFVDSVTVGDQGTLSVRTVTSIREGDTEISRSYHRSTLPPGSNLQGQDERVVALANAVWTPEVIQAYLTLEPE